MNYNQMNPYLASLYQYQNQNNMQNQNYLAPQQILQANGKASIDNLKLAPNSSAYVEDLTNPKMIWKCVSDSIGSVTATPYDISVHEEKPLVTTDNLLIIIGELNDRITKLESESNATAKDFKRGTNKNPQTKGNDVKGSE